MKCSCKELKKPAHPENVTVEFACCSCDTPLSEVVWFHSRNWRLATPQQCTRCTRIAIGVDSIGTKIKSIIYYLLRKVCQR